jgi:hypothetical protein
MDEPIQKMEKDCSAIVDAQFPEIEAHAKVWLIVAVVVVVQDNNGLLHWPRCRISPLALCEERTRFDTMDQLSI